MDREPQIASILVLGLGNLLLRDDAVGLEILTALAESPAPEVEYVDGGTQGIALCGLFGARRAVLVLDAIALGAAPGTVHRIDDPLRAAPPRAGNAHEANAGDLLATAALLGDLPDSVAIVGIEPADIRSGIGLSDGVRLALPRAIALARAALDGFRASLEAPCTS